MFARKLEEAEARGQPLLCKFCGKPVLNSQPWQIDHALSIAEGGSLWDVGNMAPAHSDCNSADGARISNSRQGRMRKWD